MGNFIADSFVEEFKDWITHYEKSEERIYSVVVLNYFNKSHQDIQEEQEKLNIIFIILENIMFTPIRDTITPNVERVDKEHIKPKQKKIILLLIRYGLSLNFIEENYFGWNIHTLVKEVEHHYIYDWIESFQEHFNARQRKEWKTIRLQLLF